MNGERDTDARLWHPWLRINRVLRVMLHTRWSAEAWSVLRLEFRKVVALRSEIRRGGINGGLVSRQGAGSVRTPAFAPMRIHGGDRNGVESASGQPGELEADSFIRSWDRARANHLSEGITRTRCIEYAVVHAIERQFCQRAPIGVRDGRGPGGGKDAGVAGRRYQKDSAEHESNRVNAANTP